MSAAPITQFQGEYRFLSNFWPVQIHYMGMDFSSTEAAYQAAKCAVIGEQYQFTKMTPAEAKRAGRRIQVRVDWDHVKVEVMSYLTLLKYPLGSDLAKKLIDTGDVMIIEGNYWGDTFWGVCRGHGKNYLGKILMKHRAWLQTYSDR